jgi:F420-non-reducing hydrogenase large subunit
MGKTLNIAPITRIEGHAHMAVHLDDAGNVEDVKLHILALRGFEKFVVGRPVEEVPRIVNRICGICPWQHHLASNKAADGCLGVTVPPAGKKLRELTQMLAYIPDKILHFYFLAAPDFVIGPDADYSVRNVVGVIGAGPGQEGRAYALQSANDAREVLRQGHPSHCRGRGRVLQAHA